MICCAAASNYKGECTFECLSEHTHHHLSAQMYKSDMVRGVILWLVAHKGTGMVSLNSSPVDLLEHNVLILGIRHYGNDLHQNDSNKENPIQYVPY